MNAELKFIRHTLLPAGMNTVLSSCQAPGIFYPGKRIKYLHFPTFFNKNSTFFNKIPTQKQAETYINVDIYLTKMSMNASGLTSTFEDFF